MKHKKNYQLIASFCFLITMMLGYTVKFYPQSVSGFDQTLQEKIQLLHTANLDIFFVWITKICNPLPAVMIVLIGCAAMLWQKRKVEAIWFLMNGVIISLILNPVLKQVIARLRPEQTTLVHETGYSFPSGHSATSVAIFISLFFLIGLWCKRKNLRVALQTVCCVAVVLIAFSRIYVGVHFPTDVLGGIFLGIGVICFGYPMMEEARFKARFKGEQR